MILKYVLLIRFQTYYVHTLCSVLCALMPGALHHVLLTMLFTLRSLLYALCPMLYVIYYPTTCHMPHTMHHMLNAIHYITLSCATLHHATLLYYTMFHKTTLYYCYCMPYHIIPYYTIHSSLCHTRPYYTTRYCIIPHYHLLHYTTTLCCTILRCTILCSLVTYTSSTGAGDQPCPTGALLKQCLRLIIYHSLLYYMISLLLILLLLSLSLYIYIYIYMVIVYGDQIIWFVCVCVYIYIYIERERDTSSIIVIDIVIVMMYLLLLLWGPAGDVSGSHVIQPVTNNCRTSNAQTKNPESRYLGSSLRLWQIHPAELGTCLIQTCRSGQSQCLDWASRLYMLLVVFLRGA